MCQRIHRQAWDADTPMDTDARPVIACVYEMEIMAAESAIWTRTMMGASPDPKAYMAERAP